MPMGGGGGGGGGGEAAEEVEEKTEFEVKIKAFDAKAKIKIIKEVRAITGLGLKEAKELVEGVPATVKKDVPKEEADEMAAKLEELGTAQSGAQLDNVVMRLVGSAVRAAGQEVREHVLGVP